MNTTPVALGFLLVVLFTARQGKAFAASIFLLLQLFHSSLPHLYRGGSANWIMAAFPDGGGSGIIRKKKTIERRLENRKSSGCMASLQRSKKREAMH
jgi:hypothetical protein